jgi:hypothetical protein
LQLPCLLYLLINKKSTTARINSCQISISVLSIPRTNNAQHTNSWNSLKSQSVHWGALHSTKTLCKVPLRNVWFFVSSRTVTPHFQIILKTAIYSETSRRLPIATAATHSTSLSFLPRVSEKPVAAKKRHRPYWNYFLAAARAHNHTVPLRNSALSITPTLSKDKTFNKIRKETFHETLFVGSVRLRVFHTPTIRMHFHGIVCLHN